MDNRITKTTFIRNSPHDRLAESTPKLYNRPMPDVVIGGKYLHYKNKEYRVLSIAIHSETMEELVIYECLYENPLGKIWARPKKMFLEEVKVDHYQGPRFRLIEEF